MLPLTGRPVMLDKFAPNETPKGRSELAFGIIQANIDELERSNARISMILSRNAVRQKRACWIRRKGNAGR